MLETLQTWLTGAVLGLPRPLVSLLAGPPIVIEGQTLDPQIQLLLRLMALQGGPQIHEMTPSEARAFYRQVAPMLGGRAPQGIRVRDLRAAGPAEEIPLRVYVPESVACPAPALVYYHGGGWVIGDRDTHDPPCRELAERLGVVVVAVDYRLAPEHRFPAAAEDASAAYRWIVEHAADLEVDPERVGVGGDSAGGNLAAVVCSAAKRDGAPMPCFQMLVYPSVDLSTEHPSWQTFAEGFFLTLPTMRWFRDHYVSEPERRDFRASPLRAEDLSGLPPAYVTTAGFDVLRDEGIAYAERLKTAGVTVTLRNHPSLIHGWISMLGTIEAARRAFDDLVAAARPALHRRP